MPGNLPKHVNTVRKYLKRKRLWITYYYAWKGGPRLRGEPGSPEFYVSYAEAHQSRRQPPDGVLLKILHLYQDSAKWRGLSPRTQRDYIKIIAVIENVFGDFPLSALSDRRSRGEFLAWRDELALSSRRQADYRFAVLARIFAWALDRGHIDTNPCTRAGRLYQETRAENVWTDADEAAFDAVASAELQLAKSLAIWTGQRQGDLLRLTWTAYDGHWIRLRQSKTGTRVVIPAGAPLRVALEATTRRSPSILTNKAGRPWTGDGFRSSWRKATLAAGITGLTFHDLRGTAVTRLALAGCTEAEIAIVTGHAMSGVRSILERHYLSRDPKLAESAIRKLEARTKTPNRAPNRS